MVKPVSLLLASASAMNANQWWTGGSYNPQPAAPKAQTGAKPLWLPWGAWSSCRGVCGSGVSNRLRRCLNGVAGVDCDGDSLDSRACDNPVDDTCSYWSGWGQWESWACVENQPNKLRRVKTRTCFGRDTDQCVGSTTIEEFDTAPIRTYCVETNQASCCPYNNRQCNEKVCYMEGQCQAKVMTDRTPISLPCCEEYSTWTSWSSPVYKLAGDECKDQPVYRSRYNVCNELQTETQDQVIRGQDGQYSAWQQVQSCDGKQLTYGPNQSQVWQCAGKQVFRRTHSCYTEGVHTVDKYGNALEFTRVESCGQDARPQLSDWDIDDASCAAVCRGSGVFRYKTLIDYCAGTQTPCQQGDATCMQECGTNGDWHLWSAWSGCSRNCGEKETRYRKHSCAQWNGQADQVEERACGFDEGWAAWGQWDATCATSYPDACADTFTKRVRTSRCGVMDAAGNFVYEDSQTSICQKPVMPAPTEIVGQCSAQCHDTRNGIYSFRNIQYVDACGQLVDQKTEQCNVPACCELGWSDWSDCTCAGLRTRSEVWICPNKQPEPTGKVESDSCQVPMLPLQPWSNWSSCDADVCTKQSSRFRCPVCADNANDPTCTISISGARQQAEYEYAECPAKTTYTCDPCYTVCGNGQQKCYQKDLCTNMLVPGTETMVACQSTYSCVPEETTTGCIHNYNNPKCPGTEFFKRSACVDKNYECSAEQSWQLPCGPTELPEAVYSQWSACDPATCTQRRSVTYECNPADNREEEQACKPYAQRNWSAPGECLASDPTSPRFYYNGETLPCSGARKQVLPPMCPGEIEEVRFIPCGLEIELDQYGNLNSETCLDNVPQYVDCMRDDMGECIFPATRTQAEACQTGIFEDVVSIIRQPVCPKWSAIQCSKTVTLPKNCIECGTTWSPFGACSDECKLGYQYREEIETCKNEFLPNEAGQTRLTGNRQWQQCGPSNPTSFSEEGECLSSGYCSKCSNTGAGLKTVTTWDEYPTLPQCGRFNIRTEQVACQLPQCPQWREEQFPTCAVCDVSVSRNRQCIKPLGAEMCDCLDTPFESERFCPVVASWSEWSAFGPCSRSCEEGEMTRTRTNICDSSQVETNTVKCTPEPTPFLPAGFTQCTSNRCVVGKHMPIEKNACGEIRYGAEQICFEPTELATTRIATGGCLMSPTEPAKACQTGVQVFIVRNECADLASQYPQFADKYDYEQCTVAPIEPTPWSEWAPCQKSCLNSGDAQEITTSQRYDQCGKLEIREQLCTVPSCAGWSGFQVTAKCSCNNPGSAIVERFCIDGNGNQAVGCIGESRFQIPCGVGTSNVLVNPTVYNLPQPSPAEMAAIKNLDLGSWTQNPGTWTAFSGCVKTCDVSGFCGSEYRSREPFCTDSDGNTVTYARIEDSRPCPCQKGEWRVTGDSCSSLSPMSCPGVRTVTKTHSCTGDVVQEPAGQCGTQGQWGAWSAFTQCSTECNINNRTPVKTRQRSWTCAGEKADEVETVACPTPTCPYFGAWSSWSACTVSCGLGQKTRTRYCHGGPVGSGFCIGGNDNLLGDETVSCDMGDCCEWDWSGWTGCCNAGMTNKRLRFRGNNCGQDVEEIQKDCEADKINPGQTYPSCSVFQQSSLQMVRNGGSLTWFKYDDSQIVNFLNPDKKRNVVYQDFKYNEDPLTHQVISQAEVINKAPVNVAPVNIAPAPIAPNMVYTPVNQSVKAQPAFNPVMPEPVAQPSTNIFSNMFQAPVAKAPVVQEPVAAPKVQEPVSSPFNPFGFLLSDNSVFKTSNNDMAPMTGHNN